MPCRLICLFYSAQNQPSKFPIKLEVYNNAFMNGWWEEETLGCESPIPSIQPWVATVPYTIVQRWSMSRSIHAVDQAPLCPCTMACDWPIQAPCRPLRRGLVACSSPSGLTAPPRPLLLGPALHTHPSLMPGGPNKAMSPLYHSKKSFKKKKILPSYALQIIGTCWFILKRPTEPASLFFIPEEIPGPKPFDGDILKNYFHWRTI
jgi:hypothetical protein